MIIQSANVGQGTPPLRHISNDAAKVVTETPVKASHAPPSSEQLRGAVEHINKAMQQSKQNVEFSVDPTTKTPVVRMVDSETGKLLRQYPSEEVLAIAQSIDQYLSQHQMQQGILLKQKA
jgi:flagellar protein FlaG